MGLVLGAMAVVVVTVGLPAFAGFGVAYHTTCKKGTEVALLPSYYIPAILVNSPYGGEAWGNATVPVSFPGAVDGPQPEGVYAVGYGTGALNGESLGAFFTVNVSVFSVANATVAGLGQQAYCTRPYSVQFENPAVFAEAGGWMLGPNNTSDASEPGYATLLYGTSSAFDSLRFNNSFSLGNSLALDTCGGPAASLPLVESSRLQVSFPIYVAGHGPALVAFTLTFLQTFHYTFPANFGSWQIDNLSAPGGPGGGWAFSYSPCR